MPLRPSRAALGAACLAVAAAGGAHALTLSSPAFENGQVIPDAFTFSLSGQCSGANQSPPLVFAQVPAGTRSLAVTVHDPDGNDWLHWKAWNIAAGVTALPANASATQPLTQGRNDFDAPGYGGPCPPTPNHRYVFTVYALNTTFEREPTLAQLHSASVQTASLTGMRSPGDRRAWTPPDRQACLFNWVERQLPEYVAPRAPATVDTPALAYRFYASTQSYLGVAKDSQHLLYFSAPTGLVDLGAVDGWASQAACP